MVERVAQQTALGVDAGSHGVRVVALRDGAPAATATAEYAGALPPARRPLDEVLEALATAVRALPPAVRDEVGALAITGVRGAVVGLDEGGRVATEVIPDFDAATLSTARRLAAERRDELVGRTGCPAFPLSGLPKLIALADAPVTWTGLPEALATQLGARLVLSRGIALRLGVMHADGRGIDGRLLADFGVDPARLAPIVEIGDPIGRLTAAAAATLGLPAGVVLVAAPGDGPSALRAARFRCGERAALVSFGTTTVVSAPAVEGLAAHLDRDVTYEITDTATNALSRSVETGDGSGMFQVDWAARVLACRPSALDDLAEARPDTPAAPATLLPLIDIWGDAERPGHPAPLETGATSSAVAALVLTTVAAGARAALARITRLTPIDHVVVTGGGSRSRLIRAAFAEGLDLPLTELSDVQLAAEGAAHFAAASLLEEVPA